VADAGAAGPTNNGMKSSFKKKSARVGVSFADVDQPNAKRRIGTKLSTHNGLPMASTGVPSIDDVFGGGLPMGSVLLIKEDRTTSYATTLLQYFLAQGAVHVLQEASNLVVITADRHDLVETLPWLHSKRSTVDDADSIDAKDLEGQLEEMTIAWRYKSQPKLTSEISGTQTKDTGYCSVFDLTTRIPPSALAQINPFVVKIDPKASSLDNVMEQFPRTSSAGPPMRIAVSGFASPSWTGWKETDLVRFLLKIKQFVREHSAVAVVTLPAYLYGDAPGLGVNMLVRRWEHLADAVLEVESFEGA